MIFLAKTDPNECSVRIMFEKAPKKVLADGMNIYITNISTYILLLPIWKQWRDLLSHTNVFDLKMQVIPKKRDFVKLVNFLPLLVVTARTL